jgi:hypothetical protein
MLGFLKSNPRMPGWWFQPIPLQIWFVSWDRDIPNIIGDLPIKNGGSFPSNIPNQIYGNIKFMFQTTNQMLLFLQRIIGY